MNFNKLFLPIGLFLVGMLWSACVDVPDGPETTIPDFRSQVRFVHAIPGVPAGSVRIDGSSIGSIDYPAATAYTNVASGSRSVAFADSAAQTVVFGSEKQSTVLIYSNAGLLSYLNLSEGDKDKNNGRAGAAKVRFVNVADGSDDVTFFYADSAHELATAAFGVSPDYTVLPPSTFAVSASTASGDTVALAPSLFEDGKVYTVVATGSGSGFQLTTFQDRQGPGAPGGKPVKANQ